MADFFMDLLLGKHPRQEEAPGGGLGVCFAPAFSKVGGTPTAVHFGFLTAR
jgi:hypothetical protein